MLGGVGFSPRQPNFDNKPTKNKTKQKKMGSTGLEIVQSDVKVTLKNTPSRKASGPHGIVVEFLKLLIEEYNGKLMKIYNRIYRN